MRSGWGRLGRPAERDAIDPHAVQNDRQPARDGNHRLSHATSFGDTQTLGLECRGFGLWSQEDQRRLEQS